MKFSLCAKSEKMHNRAFHESNEIKISVSFAKFLSSTYTYKTSHSCYMWISNFPQQPAKTPGRYICQILLNQKNQITAGIKRVPK